MKSLKLVQTCHIFIGMCSKTVYNYMINYFEEVFSECSSNDPLEMQSQLELKVQGKCT